MRKDIKLLAFAALTAALLLTLLLALLLPACGGTPEGSLPPVASGTVIVTPDSAIPTNVEPSIRGYITRITYAAEYTEILVEYFSEDGTESPFTYNKVLVKLDSKSAVAYGAANEMVSRASLGVGSQVEVWFTDPTAESYPVIAYGQAVRIISNPSSMTELRALPYLSVTGGSTCITVVTRASWNGRELNQPSMKELLETVSGAHMSASVGDIISLKFSTAPQSCTATWSSSTTAKGTVLEITSDGKLTVPEGAEGTIYIKINSEWSERRTVQYAFSITVPDAPASEP